MSLFTFCRSSSASDFPSRSLTRQSSRCDEPACARPPSLLIFRKKIPSAIIYNAACAIIRIVTWRATASRWRTGSRCRRGVLTVRRGMQMVAASFSARIRCATFNLFPELNCASSFYTRAALAFVRETLPRVWLAKSIVTRRPVFCNTLKSFLARVDSRAGKLAGLDYGRDANITAKKVIKIALARARASARAMQGTLNSY